METNSDWSEARQASANILDRLLFKAIDQIDMEADYNAKHLEFFEKVFENRPVFSPGPGSDCDPSAPVSPTSPKKPPANPDSVSSSDSFTFSVSPFQPKAVSSPQPPETPKAPLQSSSDLTLSFSSPGSGSGSSTCKISGPALAQLMMGDFIYSRRCPASPGLDLQPTQSLAVSLQPPNKKPRLSGGGQDVNANIAEDATEITEDLEVEEVERHQLIRTLAEKFLQAVPSFRSRVSLNPAGFCSPVTEDALGETPGETPVQFSFSTGPPGWDCQNLRRKS